MTEDELVGWHHQLNGHEPDQTPGDSGGQKRYAVVHGSQRVGHEETDACHINCGLGRRKIEVPLKINI